MKRIAVIAHYDTDSIGDEYFLELLNKLNHYVEKIVVVTTSGIDNEFLKKNSSLEIISRENVGYDFYSYKVGIDSIDDIRQYDQLLVLNDSFYTTKSFDLRQLLSQSVERDIYSITSTNQFAYHLQSFFLVFNKNAILSSWFYKFWKNVFIYKRKIKIIFDYEINLTSTALRSGLSVGSMFFSKDIENPCHKDPKLLLEKTGIIKIDVLRNKIAELDYSVLEEAPVIDAHLTRTSEGYKDRILGSSSSEVTAGNSFFEFTTNNASKTNTAILLHLFYIDLMTEIRDHLSIIPFNYDLFITIPDEIHLACVINTFIGKCNNLYVAVVSNQGRDVLPFIKLMKHYDFNQYDFALKIHTKKSKYSELGDQWRSNLYSNLIPSAAAVLKLRHAFVEGNIGIAANLKDYLSNDNYWGANVIRYNVICDKLNIKKNDRELFFVGGTMFWLNPKAIYPLIDQFDESDFEEELNQQDGTLAHVFERLTCKSALSVGMRTIDMNSLLDVTPRQVISNEVIVLN